MSLLSTGRSGAVVVGIAALTAIGFAGAASAYPPPQDLEDRAG